MKWCSTLFIMLFLIGCMEKIPEITWHGHRGCRGLMPENTIEGFVHALEYPIEALEMDVVVTKDKKILVSHEPYMSSQICLDPLGTKVTNELSHNIYQLSLEEIQQYDCGSLELEKFPDQMKFSAKKPTLNEVVFAVDSLLKKSDRKIVYNIEAKSKEGFDDIYHPGPLEYAQLLLNDIEKLQISERTIIQSFDFRILKEIYNLNSNIDLAMLVDNENSPEQNLEALGFTPKYYSPNFRLVTQDTRNFCNEHNMRLIVWTVNELEDMKQMITLGVDDIITDYPNRISQLED